MLSRKLDLKLLLGKKSHFLFGPRGTGKTTITKSQIADSSLYVSLLNSDFYLRLSARPAELEQIIEASNKKLVVIDEFQKIPVLLDEVHRLIEDKKITFLLTGSSARKLRVSGTNLLAGRSWTARLFPLSYIEIPSFELERYLLFGGLPAVYLSKFPYEELQSYVHTYLIEEISAEGLVRDLPRFSRFLQKAALSNGEILNFSEIASDLGVSPSTIREYYRILEDTLLGYLVEPLRKPKSRKEVSTSKFYLFDVGVVNMLRLVKSIPENTEYYGVVFKQFIGQEIRAALSYQRINCPLHFWRTQTQHEVDFVIADQLAIEVKAAKSANLRMAKGLRYFNNSFKVKYRCLVSRDPVERVEDGIHFLSYQSFLARLWAGEWFLT